MTDKKFSVYCHTNKTNGKRYIGITCQEASQRWRHGLGYKIGPFRRAIEKYGWDGFAHEVLYSGLSEDEAKEKEIALIEKYQTYSKYHGYNATKGGDGTCGYKRSDAERLAMSISRKGRPGHPVSEHARRIISEKTKERYFSGGYDFLKKPVIVQKESEILKFDSIQEASRATGVINTHISRVCRGKRKHAGGYTWRYGRRTVTKAGERMAWPDKDKIGGKLVYRRRDSMGGRGSASGKQSGKAKQTPTKATQVENMNEAQIGLETRKAQRALERVQTQIGKLNGASQEERDLRDAFPLGTGGLSGAGAKRQAGKLAERARINAGKLSDAINRRESLQKQLDRLQQAKKDVAGTGKTQSQIREERKAAEVKNTASTLKWKTTNKGGFMNGGYMPKVIQAGNYEIRGTSGFYRVYVGHGSDAKQIWQSSKLSEAKTYAEKHKKRA